MFKFFFIIFASLISSFFLASARADSQNGSELVEALIAVESAGNDYALGDTNLPDHAYGCLQIRQPLCDDIYRRYGLQYSAESCQGNRQLSLKIFGLYMDMYATEGRLGHVPTDEDKARIWNGGPSGWRRKSTVPYWNKVKRVLG